MATNPTDASNNPNGLYNVRVHHHDGRHEMATVGGADAADARKTAIRDFRAYGADVVETLIAPRSIPTSAPITSKVQSLDPAAWPASTFNAGESALDSANAALATVFGTAPRPFPRPDVALTADGNLSMVVIAQALASRGLTLRAVNGQLRVVMANITRREALKLGRDNARDSMFFTPFDGNCTSCGADLVAQYGLHAIAGGMNVTGCRKCCTSFCD